jgi:hypothetical protein
MLIKKPDLKLIINKTSDTKNAQYFLRSTPPIFIKWFLPSDFYFVTDKKFSKAEKNKIISAYTDYFYQDHKKEIVAETNKTIREWKKVEPKFYRLVDFIFKGYQWPKGNYTGCASIYYMYPRDIKNKYFYFPYFSTHHNPIAVIAHEMLHFIFFDYIKSTYGIKEETEIKGKDPKYVWQVSETFNNILENWSPYANIIPQEKKSIPYPGCEKMYQIMETQWRKNPDINKFLNNWF